MAMFGWTVLLLSLIYITVVGGFALFFGGLDLGPAPAKWWLIIVSVLSGFWWLLVTNAPFSIVAGV